MNKIYKNIHSAIILMLGMAVNAHAQQNLSFQQISTRDGLSQNTVRSILVDKKGFVWAGTLDGLVRYDGNRFINYKPKPGELNTISDQRIRSINEDKNGFLWIKTYDNFYSCYNPKTESFINFTYNDVVCPLHYEFFKETASGQIWLWGSKGCVRIESDVQNPKITFLAGQESANLPNSNIKFICEGIGKYTWLGCENGLVQLDSAQQITSHYIRKSAETFFKAIPLNHKIYFLSKSNCIYTYDANEEAFVDSFMYKNDDEFVNGIALDSSRLLVSTLNHGLVGFYTQSGVFDKKICPFKNDFTSAPQFIVDEKSGIWVYDNSGKIQYFNAQERKVKSLRLINEKVAHVIDNGRYNVLIDKNNQHWITTYGNGLYQYNPENDSLVNYSYRQNDNSPASNYLLSIAEDNYGNIWLGSEYAGIIKVTSQKFEYRYIKPEIEESIGSTNNVKVVFEDSNRNIWLGTKNGGLYIYNKELKEKKCIQKAINPYTIMEDYVGRIWVGTKGDGVYLLDKNNYSVLQHFRNTSSASSLCSNSIFDIIQDKDQQIWIASFGGGLDLLQEHESTFTFQHYFANKGNCSFIRCMIQDKDGLIWMGTYGGLICFDPNQLKINPDSYTLYTYSSSHPLGLNCNDVKSVFQDYKGQIWIGTAGGGVNRLVKDSEDQQGEFVKYTKTEGLPSSIITAIVESGDSVLWVSTENGLAHLSKNEKNFVAYNFSKETTGNFYSENAALLQNNGTLLLGTLDGLLAFNPQSIKLNHKVPKVTLTDFYVFGHRMESSQNPKTLEQSISEVSSVTLDNNQRTFTINFASLDLSDSKHNKYSYKLNPYDEYWSTPGTNAWATYKNVPPGTYTFEVKGSNADGVWNQEVTRCELVVLPPWWKTWWAITIYFAIFISLVIIFVRFMLRINHLNSAVKIEKQLTDYKLRFFTNISHEFRTPLTLIKGAIERLYAHDDLPDTLHHHVDMLSRNTQQMSRLIDQLLEFRKIQNNVLTLNLEKTDIGAFVLDAYYAFKEIAFQKEIDYQFEGMDDTLEIYIDKNKVEKILFNLLSNAFRYTPAKGKITCRLSVDAETQHCVMSVVDSGIGIPADKQDLLFSRFMQINFSPEGTGVGLELVKEFTEVHKGKVSYSANPTGGSVFTVELPLQKEAYNDARFVKEITSAESKDNLLPAPKEESIERPVQPHHWKLLIIDDNYDIRAYLKDEMQHHFNIYQAVNGKEGLEKAVEINPTLIICDVKMPEMDGLELTRRLKDNFETSHIPIILLTAMSSDTMQLKGSESGADAYIMKPFSMRFLLSRVYALIEQREKLKKRFSVDIQVKEGALSEEKKDQDFYNKINQIIDKHLSNPAFSVAQFTDEAQLSRTIFYKKVKGITGYSPNELIKVKRMKKAAELLLNGELNVSEVSWQVGIEDPFYFSKCFKAQFGCSPSKYTTQKTIEVE